MKKFIDFIKFYPQSIIFVFVFLLVSVVSSCRYEKSDEIVMDKNGNFYVLQPAFSHNAYRLYKIDTTKYKPVQFEKYLKK